MATYSALRDPSGTLWYLTAEGLPDGSAALLALSTSVPPGSDLTPTQPFWLGIDVPALTPHVSPFLPTGWVVDGWLPFESEMLITPWLASGWVLEGWIPLGDAPDQTRWYLWPLPTGEVEIATSPPTGTGLVITDGLLLTDTASRGWLLRITPWGELSTEAVLVTALARADGLTVHGIEGLTLVARRLVRTGADTLTPRLTDGFSGLVQPTPLRMTRTDTLVLHLTEQALPPDARLLPLPQGFVLRGRVP